MAAAVPIPNPSSRHSPDLESERGFRVAFLGLLAALITLAWHNRFLQDDAFIAFRYADNLARGQGLVFNVGERVEGYTCFLYVLLVAAAMKLGVPAIAASFTIGLASCALSLVMTFRLGMGLSGRRVIGLLAMLLLGANYSFSAYATGGLETQLETALVVVFLALGAEVLLGRPYGPRRLILLSKLAALAIMTRPDSVLLVTPVGVALAARIMRPSESRRGLHLAAFVAPAVLLLAGWSVWKVLYYGNLLPNTFYAKVGAGRSLALGFYFIEQFLTSYWLAPLLLIALWRPRDLVAPAGVGIPLIVTLAIWVTYVIGVGGDFMEFRLMVPAMPIVAWFIARTAVLLQRDARLGAAIVAIALLGSLHHAIAYNHISHPDEIESVWKLQSHLTAEDQDWIGVGQVLGRELAYDPHVTIATTAAGAIPFYSRVSCIDMLGLNDAWIARHGDVWGLRIGHLKHATLDYLIERHVNLLIGHPMLVWQPTPATFSIKDFPMPRWAAANGRAFPPGLRAVEIPVSREYRLIALYLTPSARVDEAIRRYGWRVRTVVPSSG